MGKRYTWQVRSTFHFANKFSEWETYGVAEYTLWELLDKLGRSRPDYYMSSVMIIDDGEFMVLSRGDRWVALTTDYVVHFRRKE